MVVSHIRLRKGRVGKIVCGGVLQFQKELGCELVIRLQEVDFGVFQLYILHILHKLAVVIVPKYELSGDYPRPAPVGAFAFDFASFLKAIHEPLHSGKGNSQHLYNIFLRYFWIGSEDAQNRFFIGIIGFNFGVIGIIGVTFFRIDDTLLIGSRVFTI